MTSNLSDNELARLIAENADKGLEAAITLYGGSVKYVCTAILGKYPRDCEECVSDSFAELWRKIGKYDPSRGTLKSYVCIIARSLALSRLNKLAGARETVCEDIWLEAAADSAGAAGEAEGNELFDAVVSFISSMPPPDKDILANRFILFAKPSEIAAKLKLPKKQVENKLYRGRKKLCAFLAAKGMTKEAYLSEI